MKGNEKLIAKLNSLLADELTAISQYMVHGSMCDNWGYDKLHHAIEERAITEMKHAEMHIDRILFLEGTPVVSNLNKMHIGTTVEEQLKFDHESEAGAIKAYNEAISLAVEVGDNGTKEFLDAILKDEEKHIDWIEAQLDQIGQMGSPNYLAKQLD